MSQLINVTSEALQATIRRLLPSQAGFSEDLQATNLITPIIDLTPTAEGSVLPTELQQAVNFGGASTFAVQGSSSGLTSTPGFYRIRGAVHVQPNTSGTVEASVILTEGASSKNVWRILATSNTNTASNAIDLDFIFFISAGQSASVSSSDVRVNLTGSLRQIATVNGTLVQPQGFTFE
jgi:hypothetical protein